MANEPLQYGRYYHIYNRGNNGETLFASSRNYRFFLQRYAKYIEPVAETYAYCLLPNHFHFAIRTRDDPRLDQSQQQASQSETPGKDWSNLGDSRLDQSQKLSSQNETPGKDWSNLVTPSRAFNNLFISYARAFNKEQGRTGVLFERPFHRKPVDSEGYWLTLIAYIHRNPQRHGLVADFRDWPWSSYGAILAAGATKVQREAVLEWYNGRDAFIDAHASEDDEQMVAPLLLEDWF